MVVTYFPLSIWFSDFFLSHFLCLKCEFVQEDVSLCLFDIEQSQPFWCPAYFQTVGMTPTTFCRFGSAIHAAVTELPWVTAWCAKDSWSSNHFTVIPCLANGGNLFSTACEAAAALFRLLFVARKGGPASSPPLQCSYLFCTAGAVAAGGEKSTDSSDAWLTRTAGFVFLMHGQTSHM